KRFRLTARGVTSTFPPRDRGEPRSPVEGASAPETSRLAGGPLSRGDDIESPERAEASATAPSGFLLCELCPPGASATGGRYRRRRRRQGAGAPLFRGSAWSRTVSAWRGSGRGKVPPPEAAVGGRCSHHEDVSRGKIPSLREPVAAGRENKSAIRLVPLRGMVYLPSHVEGATRRRTRSGGKPTVKVHRRFGFA